MVPIGGFMDMIRTVRSTVGNVGVDTGTYPYIYLDWYTHVLLLKVVSPLKINTGNALYDITPCPNAVCRSRQLQYWHVVEEMQRRMYFPVNVCACTLRDSQLIQVCINGLPLLSWMLAPCAVQSIRMKCLLADFSSQ